jgi:hypothetical protein
MSAPRTRAAGLGVIAGLAFAAAPAGAAPVVRQAVGADAPAIQATVDQFRADLGEPNNGNTSGSQPTGRRQITWDGADADSAPSRLPGNFFNAVAPRGAILGGPTDAFQVSADAVNPTGTPIEFGHVNATYPTAFAPFSLPRLFAPLTTNVYETTFLVPGDAAPATTSGFGAIFTDVDAPASSKIDYFAPDGSSLGSFAVPAMAGDASLSFLGVSFDAGERVARVVITNGAAPLGPNDVTQGGQADVVVNDDFLYAEPQPFVAPPPPPDLPSAPDPPPAPEVTSPSVTLAGVPRALRLGRLLRGLRVSLTPSEAASFELTLLAKPRRVQVAQFDLVLARRTLTRAAEPRTVLVRPKRRLLRRTARRFRLRLRVSATDAAGNTSTTSRTIRVRR